MLLQDTDDLAEARWVLEDSLGVGSCGSEDEVFLSCTQERPSPLVQKHCC